MLQPNALRCLNTTLAPPTKASDLQTLKTGKGASPLIDEKSQNKYSSIKVSPSKKHFRSCNESKLVIKFLKLISKEIQHSLNRFRLEKKFVSVWKLELDFEVEQNLTSQSKLSIKSLPRDRHPLSPNKRCPCVPVCARAYLFACHTSL